MDFSISKEFIFFEIKVSWGDKRASIFVNLHFFGTSADLAYACHRDWGNPQQLPWSQQLPMRVQGFMVSIVVVGNIELEIMDLLYLEWEVWMIYIEMIWLHTVYMCIHMYIIYIYIYYIWIMMDLILCLLLDLRVLEYCTSGLVKVSIFRCAENQRRKSVGFFPNPNWRMARG